MKLALTHNEVFFPGSYFVADLQAKNAAPEADMVSGYEDAPSWNVAWPFHVATVALMSLAGYGMLRLVEAVVA